MLARADRIEAVPGPADSITALSNILKGAKPRDLPVQQPTKFELVIDEEIADCDTTAAFDARIGLRYVAREWFCARWSPDEAALLQS